MPTHIQTLARDGACEANKRNREAKRELLATPSLARDDACNACEEHHERNYEPKLPTLAAPSLARDDDAPAQVCLVSEGAGAVRGVG